MTKTRNIILYTKAKPGYSTITYFGEIIHGYEVESNIDLFQCFIDPDY